MYSGILLNNLHTGWPKTLGYPAFPKERASASRMGTARPDGTGGTTNFSSSTWNGLCNQELSCAKPSEMLAMHSLLAGFVSSMTSLQPVHPSFDGNHDMSIRCLVAAFSHGTIFANPWAISNFRSACLSSSLAPVEASWVQCLDFSPHPSNQAASSPRRLLLSPFGLSST